MIHARGRDDVSPLAVVAAACWALMQWVLLAAFSLLVGAWLGLSAARVILVFTR